MEPPVKNWNSASVLKRRRVDLSNKKVNRHVGVPKDVLRQALEDARKHDPMVWVRQIANWQLEELRSRRSSALY